MTVAELIAVLSKFDGDKEVLVYCPNGSYLDITSDDVDELADSIVIDPT